MTHLKGWVRDRGIMTYSKAFKDGVLALPAAVLFNYQHLFKSAQDFLVWQYFYFQNTSALDELLPSQVAEASGLDLVQVNQSISNLTSQGLLTYKEIELNGEVDAIFDARVALEVLDSLLAPSQSSSAQTESGTNPIKDLVETFNQERGSLATPTEVEELTKMVEVDGLSPDLIKAALREAIFNGVFNLRYIQAILRNWKSEGITSPIQVEAKRRERDRQVQAAPVTDDFAAALDLWSD